MHRLLFFALGMIGFLLNPLVAGHFDGEETLSVALEPNESDDSADQKMDGDSAEFRGTRRSKAMLKFGKVAWVHWQGVACFLSMQECLWLSSTCRDAQEGYLCRGLSPVTLIIPANINLGKFLRHKDRWTSLRTLTISSAIPLEPDSLALLPLEHLEEVHWLPGVAFRTSVPAFLEEQWTNAMSVIRERHGVLRIRSQGDEQGFLEIERAQLGPSYVGKWTITVFPDDFYDDKSTPTVLSPRFNFQGHEWGLILYPHGNPSCVPDKSAMSLYIQNGTRSEKWSYCCKFKLTAEVKISSQDEFVPFKVSHQATDYFSFGSWMKPVVDRGWHRMVPLDKLGTLKGSLLTWEITVELQPRPGQK